jgi:hypothetical protein
VLVRLHGEQIFARPLLRFDLTHRGRLFDQIAERVEADRLRYSRSVELRGTRWRGLC